MNVNIMVINMEEYLLIPVGLGVSAAGLGVAPVLTLFCTATYKL